MKSSWGRTIRGAIQFGNQVNRKSKGGLVLQWSALRERYETYAPFEMRHIPKAAGFYWDPGKHCWATEATHKAIHLMRYADRETRQRLHDLTANRIVAVD